VGCVNSVDVLFHPLRYIKLV